MPNGGFDFLDFFIGEAGVLDSIIDLVQNALNFVFNVFAKIAIFEEFQILSLQNFLGGALNTIGRALRHILSDIIHLRFGDLLQKVRDLYQRVRDFLAPIIKLIDRIRAIYRLYVLKPLLAYLNLIQRLRMLLAIFRVFHLKFAERLDRKLLELEAKAIRNTLRIWQELNIAISVLQLILDPALLFRRVPLVLSASRAITQLLGALFGHSLHDVFGSGAPAPPLPGPPATLRQGMDRILVDVKDNTGDAAKVREHWQRMFDKLKLAQGA